MITHYFCKSNTLGIQKCQFTLWHKHEIENTGSGGTVDRDSFVSLSRLQALELCSKWSRIAAAFCDGGNYWIL